MTDESSPKPVQREIMREYGSYSAALGEFIAFLTDAYEKLTPEERGTASVDFDGGGYDESACITVTYRSWETPEEVARRIEAHERYERQYEAEKRAEYERLKKRFGP